MHEFNEFFHVRVPSDNLRRASRSRIAVQGLVLSRMAVAEFLKFLASASHTEKEGRGWRCWSAREILHGYSFELQMAATILLRPAG